MYAAQEVTVKFFKSLNVVESARFVINKSFIKTTRSSLLYSDSKLLSKKYIILARGGGVSIVKVPGDVPPARVYFLGFLGILVKEMLKFGNFGRKTQLFWNFGRKKAKIWQVLPRKCQFRALLKEKLV